jgi:hypothetical protein
LRHIFASIATVFTTVTFNAKPITASAIVYVTTKTKQLDYEPICSPPPSPPIPLPHGYDSPLQM